ncbi:hypothetical protein FEDK69T_18030 [Flavobacterium enshiense DK69]|uniref:Uncharacterized protein n=1 Tax=Flavobacterium enshiense DK69 TaxID=1107311 RepID=V6S882_9FLAO|nr:hypothetical protein [Flavobacterium enshiense]ESU22898.1 hypothetical protein FEDK69T_18030 [Flavobacterium enshiense DK69]KGO94030.1 hypothetical protein Q767_13940 [Flavobacterium enshiense DK69]
MDNTAIKFKFYIGGYFGSQNEVEYNENYLICSVPDYPGESVAPFQAIHVADDPDWVALLEFTRNLKWRSSYRSDVLDGTQWEFEFAFMDTTLKSHGSNKYPKEFDQFLALLNKLLSKHNIPKVY